MNKATILAAAALAAALSAPAVAAEYPDRPVTLVVPFPPGGSSDLQGRLIAERLSEKLGQQFVVVNKAGAGGNIASAATAKEKPDGYTLMVTTPAQVVNHRLYATAGYDFSRDFTPVSGIATAPMVFIANSSFPATSLGEFIEHAKKHPGDVNYATGGVGLITHLEMEMLKSVAGIDVVHIPYKGAGPALNDVVAGQVPVMVDSIMTAYPHVKAGKIRAFAVTTPERSPLAPEIPTVSELGYPQLTSGTWSGIIAPTGTPPEIIEVLNRAVNEALADPALGEKFVSFGAVPLKGSVAEFSEFLKNEEKKWADVVEAANVKIE